MATLTVWKFDSPTGAGEALGKLSEVQKQHLIEILDAAIVEWPQGKKKPKTRQVNDLAVGGALSGAFWGMLFGMLFFVPFFGLAVGAAMGACQVISPTSALTTTLSNRCGVRLPRGHQRCSY